MDYVNLQQTIRHTKTFCYQSVNFIDLIFFHFTVRGQNRPTFVSLIKYAKTP